jgi:succinate dehydrogenase hydrophobic anchor subunit
MRGAESSFLVRLLEGIAAALLVLVVLSLGWMMGAAYSTFWPRLATPEMEVIVLLVLLCTTLCQVSLVALLQTRPRGPSRP